MSQSVRGLSVLLASWDELPVGDPTGPEPLGLHSFGGHAADHVIIDDESARPPDLDEIYDLKQREFDEWIEGYRPKHPTGATKRTYDRAAARARRAQRKASKRRNRG